MVKKIAERIKEKGGEAFMVGGCVRDEIMGINKAKDIDVEVFGLTADELESILSEFGEVDLVGRSFGVFQF